MVDRAGRPLYSCIYVLEGMLKNKVPADSIRDLYEKLEFLGVVAHRSLEGLSDLEILNIIYADSEHTTGRLVVYKFNEHADEEEEDDVGLNDDYIICKHGVV